MTAFSTYVIIDRRGRYCRFGSYGTVAFTDNALSATHYTRERDAFERSEQTHYAAERESHEVFTPDNFRVVRITLELIEQKPIRKGHR